MQCETPWLFLRLSAKSTEIEQFDCSEQQSRARAKKYLIHNQQAVTGKMSARLETDRDVQAWKEYVSKAVAFLKRYSHLADAYILDFFVKESWSTIPGSWGQTLDFWSAEKLSAFIAGDGTDAPKSTSGPPAVVPPLSLLCYGAACRTVSLAPAGLETGATAGRPPTLQTVSLAPAGLETGATAGRPPTPQTVFLAPAGLETGAQSPHRSALAACPARSGQGDGHSDAASGSPVDAATEAWPEDAAGELTAAGGQLRALHHVFRRHVKPKKQHEMRRLARLVELTAPELVVDLGSGQGHLSRYLAYGSRLPVVCLESNAVFVRGARTLDEQLEKTMMKREGCVLSARPLHSACHISEDMDHREFAEMLCRLTGAPAASLRFTALGLHTCGDLAPLMLRQFVRSPHCGAVVSVGCCYMKLSTATDAWHGYPLSEHVAAVAAAQRYAMSYEAREVACHAIEEYASRLRGGGEQHLKIHAYRAALERALVAWDPALKHAGLRGVTRGHTLPFEEYARRALARLPVAAESLDLAPAAADLRQWRRVVAFYSLRLMLAPVIETVILLDRMLYLWEHGHPSILVPAFDPKLSPRNFVLMAKKR
ncbi:protein RRNAD1-like [Pollicipes pollicipes]|uniref:protein RRNAD1-like n=1 Tax=Pollicipes pollicipes TaxID=41117 RepID=UPI001885860F|nr:protein RRNAD1-like [Pollicipes pollicipes]